MLAFRVFCVGLTTICWLIGLIALVGQFARPEIDVQISLGVIALGWFAAGWFPYRLYKD